MRFPLTILTLVAMLFSLASPAIGLASSPPEPGPLQTTPWYGPTTDWQQNMFTVQRFAISDTPLRHALGGTELRRLGFLPLTNTANDLYLFNVRTNRLYDTDYALPTVRWCNGCYTSGSMSEVGVITIKDEQLVVQRNQDTYLLNPVTLKAERWFEATAHDQELRWYTPLAHNDQLYLVHPNGTNVGTPQRIDQPNDLTPVLSVTMDLDMGNPGVPSPYPGLQLTDMEGDMYPTYVGQVGSGVYFKHAGSGLHRLGYTGTTTRSLDSNVTLQEPRLLDRLHVAWIGADDALYVAAIGTFNVNRVSGMQDIPRGVPFKAVSSPEVYYYDLWQTNFGGGNPAVYNFENEADYYEAMNTTHFRQVVTLPDSVVDHQELQRMMLETELLADWTTFREHIYNTHQ